MAHSSSRWSCVPQALWSGNFFQDLMHTKYLGTDQVLLGSCASWVAKKVLPMTFEKNLEHLLESLEGMAQATW